ncbi:hypothetical protein BKA65DRAFT_536877 [Rhexocercosporidium sp. MPI-PUGE-AT-0058]|nr:hypothetical protein BKA65DRAFT_536877 [Rhexocercosporidium sp. MPI-PUGE-AT-0058]
MSLTGAAIGGSVGLAGVCIAKIVQHARSSDPDTLASPDNQSPLTPACQESLQQTESKCGCDDANNEPLASRNTARVYLCLFVAKHDFLPLLPSTTHWAMEVDGIFYELWRDYERPTGFKLAHGTRAERMKMVGGKEYKDPIFRLPMGTTHLTEEQLIQIGEKHARGYVWDRLLRNCQTFLHEAYFGKPTFNPLRSKHEIRCSKHGPLRAMPAVTMIVLSTSFALLYLAEQGVELYFHMVLSPMTLIMRFVPLLVGFTFFIPAALRLFKSIRLYYAPEFEKYVRQMLQRALARESGYRAIPRCA